MAQILVGILGSADALLEQCRSFLSTSAIVRPLGPEAASETLGLDVILVVAGSPMVETLPLVAELRANNQRAPIVIMASGITSEMALEFVHRGADDFVPLPLNKAALRLKVERSLRERAGRSLQFASSMPGTFGGSGTDPAVAPKATSDTTEPAPPPMDGADTTDAPAAAPPLRVPGAGAKGGTAKGKSAAKVKPMVIPIEIPMSLIPLDVAPAAGAPSQPPASARSTVVVKTTGAIPGLAAGAQPVVPVLPPLEQEMTQAAGYNQRRCFRSKPPPRLPAKAAFQTKEGIIVQMAIENLSIPTDGWPGGLLVAFPESDKALFMEAGWHKMREFPLAIHVPGGAPIPTVARIVPGPLREAEGMLRFAVQYLNERPTDMPRLQQYWMECQRHWLY